MFLYYVCLFVLFVSVKTALEVGTKNEEMKQRTAHMRKVCTQFPKRRRLLGNIQQSRLFYLSEKYKLSYCRVAKVGSTFWTQVFMTLLGIKPEYNKAVDSVFEVPRDEAHETIKLHENILMELTDKRIHSTTSFLVARNPYSRLFSSYIDQIYLPNKWDIARYIVRDPKRRKCGNDITFNEFLLFVSISIIRNYSLDLHWSPIFSLCLPCETKIDILAKQETFAEDTEYILNLVGVEEATVEEIKRAASENSAEASIASLVHTYVTKGHDIEKGCISESALAERIWHAFQIQGYIHNDIAFPNGTFKNILPSELETKLTETVLSAVKTQPLTSYERVNQRQEWKTSFWSEVSNKTLAKVQDAFFEDFLFFQYDSDPAKM